MAVVTMRQLLESGVHFGHQTRRWNPKMKRFIFTERNGIYIIDLQQSLADIDHAYDFVKQTVAHGGNILFIGTKKQAQEAIAEQAARVGMPYVNQRWLGGMLTNFTTVHRRLQRLKELEEVDFDDVAGSGFTKKELLMMRREKEKLERTLGGIRDMNKVPSAVWVIDTKKEHLAVAEARKLGVPVVAILDTNCDPDEVDYGIPGNDDAIRSVSLLTRVVADAVAEGLVTRHSGSSGATGAEAEPLAEWERELLAADEGEQSDEVSPVGAGAHDPELSAAQHTAGGVQDVEAVVEAAESREREIVTGGRGGTASEVANNVPVADEAQQAAAATETAEQSETAEQAEAAANQGETAEQAEAAQQAAAAQQGESAELDEAAQPDTGAEDTGQQA